MTDAMTRDSGGVGEDDEERNSGTPEDWSTFDGPFDASMHAGSAGMRKPVAHSVMADITRLPIELPPEPEHDEHEHDGCNAVVGTENDRWTDGTLKKWERDVDDAIGCEEEKEQEENRTRDSGMTGEMTEALETGRTRKSLEDCVTTVERKGAVDETECLTTRRTKKRSGSGTAWWGLACLWRRAGGRREKCTKA